MARTMRSGGRSNASSRVRKPARRRPSSSACTCSDSEIELLARVEQQHPLRAARGRRDAARGVQPAGRPAEGELTLGLASLAVLGEFERGQQDLLHRALDRAHGEALLHHAVGALLVEVVERVEHADRRARALAALTGELDGRRDVVGLEQRPAERLELRQLVLPVAALGPARLRVAEAALPASKRVGADPQQLCGRIRSYPAQVASVQTASQQRCAITSHAATPYGRSAEHLHKFSARARRT